MIFIDKLEKLKSNLKSMESVVVAFSGGVDSSFLLKVAFDVLGEKVLAVTVKSSMIPEREIKEAIQFAADFKIPHRVVEFNELEIKGFSENPQNRCYLCKLEIFKTMKALAEQEGYRHLVEGSNLDDLGDYRPGMQALSELVIVSPLKEVGFTKDEIRQQSKDLGLTNWNKPSLACLASRIPYGDKITKEKLAMVDQAEQILINLGFIQVRVRHHGEIARIELSEQDFLKIIDPTIRNSIDSRFHKLGFKYTALDLKGYRTGSMNEGLLER